MTTEIGLINLCVIEKTFKNILKINRKSFYNYFIHRVREDVYLSKTKPIDINSSQFQLSHIRFPVNTI